MPLSCCTKVQDNPLRLPLTPPDFLDGLNKEADDDIINLATHVIATERDALTNLHNLYHSDPAAQRSFKQALHVIGKTSKQGGRVIVTGMGKSGKIGQKFVATLNSFGIRSAFLHPTEAMHGDLGMIGLDDTLVFLTYSGRTPEVLSLLSHLPATLPLVAVTSHEDFCSCPLFTSRSSELCTLLPAPIPRAEVEAFGVPTPTSSTTTALALTDALALVLARQLHPNPSAIFHHYHPGGAIGASAAPAEPQLMESIATRVNDVPIIEDRQRQSGPIILNALLTAARSASGWVRPSSDTIIAPRQIQRIGRMANLNQPLSSLKDMVVVERLDWISIPGANSIQEAQQWILHMRQTSRGRTFLKSGTILGIVDSQQCVSGVVEIEEIIDEDQLQQQL
ncbi:MAG: hypothetical protein L6R38_007654 [Xanthoria sp. 2 TBL-2021]|nr:MAG: hypothetical protein L6R38_007654 [Xanthoria sp. 2 TBL-2021]